MQTKDYTISETGEVFYKNPLAFKKAKTKQTKGIMTVSERIEKIKSGEPSALAEVMTHPKPLCL